MVCELLQGSHHIQGVVLDNKGVTLRMLQTLHLKIHIKSRPLDGILATHADIENIADGSITHPWDTIVREEIVVTAHAEHDTIGVNH